ncbi:MAG: type IV pilus twitching motility protein PilT [Planctomycetota bacterium]
MLPVNKLLEAVVELDGSDLHLAVGRPPTIRHHGKLRSLDLPELTPDDTHAVMKAITPDRCQVELNEERTTDFGFAFGDLARFRVSVFYQKGNLGVVLRVIPSEILTFEEIGLAPSIKNLLLKPRGLFLVTGPTGCGKTTTLATMINFINSEAQLHIITLEDPIEYYHEHNKSIITQREIGVDCPAFSEGLRRGLRQDPDVILVGEMRDLDTIAAAIQAAETGHLVFGTLHTTGAYKTIDRIIGAFPTNQQEQIRMQLSTSLLAVISQVLMPTADGEGRVAAFEIMVCVASVRHMIRKNETFKIDSVIETGEQQGMIRLDNHLFELYMNGQISFASMMRNSQSPQELEKKVKAIASSKKK